MNILTPAALDNAELAYVHAVAEAVMAGETDSEKITKVGLQAAFDAAIAKLIEEERAFDNLPDWENEIIIKKVKP